MFHKPLILVLSLSLFFSGCKLSSDAVNWLNDNLAKPLGLKISSETSKTQDSASGNQKEDAAPSSDHRQVNGEFIKELFKVTLLREVRSEEEYNKLMNVLDQGGHYEGIYNGIVYGEEYRRLEKGAAPVPAVKQYADVMTYLILNQRYDPLRIKKPDDSEVPHPLEEEGAAPPQPSDAERAELTGEYERQGITKSFFTLKKELGEQVLKTIELKHEYKEKLATWYGRFAVYMSKKNVDFGLAQRNKSDEYFHYKWALNADEDRLKWECLNRVHQLINTQSK